MGRLLLLAGCLLCILATALFVLWPGKPRTDLGHLAVGGILVMGAIPLIRGPGPMGGADCTFRRARRSAAPRRPVEEAGR